MAHNSYHSKYPSSIYGDNRSDGRTLYVSGGQSFTVYGKSTLAICNTPIKQVENESHDNKEEMKWRLELREKIHKVALQGKEETIASLRDTLLQYERHVQGLESKAEGSTKSCDGQLENHKSFSSVQKLLDQIDTLQKEKDMLLRKVTDYEVQEDSDLPLSSFETDETDLMELAQMESCTTDTEKELAKIKRVKLCLDHEVKKLRKDNAHLREKLITLGVNASVLTTGSSKNISRYPSSQASLDAKSDALEDSGYLDGVSVSSLENNFHLLQQKLELKAKEFYQEGSKNGENYTMNEVIACVNSVYQEFMQVKEAYLALRQEANAAPLSLQDMVVGIQLQVQKSLTDINAKHKEVVDKYLREMKLRKKFHNELVELRGNIRVLCRVRPWIKEDGTEESAIVVTLDANDDSLIKISNKGRTQLFDVDKAFGIESTQPQIFEEVSSLVRSVVDGYNVCIFAYGQTGSGKTHTMEGPKSDPGINQRALQLLFEETVDENWQYEISASVMEIYNEVIRDLLNPDPDCKLEVKMKPEGGLHVPGLVSVPVSNLTMVNEIFETGRKNRATATTNMNEHSSRSHCLLCVTVTGYNPTTGSRSLGHLNLVDLAGSERVSKSQADGIHLKEAQNINKSLSCLGDVIHALRNKHAHVPYRNSKLTYMLQDSLGGDSKTLMIVQVSPVEKNVSETVCTLSFGQRVRSVELGAASKNTHLNKSTPNNRTSSMLTSSRSVSSSLSSLASSPSNRSSLPPSPSASPRLPLKQSLSSSSLAGRKKPFTASQVSLNSVSASASPRSRRSHLHSRPSTSPPVRASSVGRRLLYTPKTLMLPVTSRVRKSLNNIQ